MKSFFKLNEHKTTLKQELLAGLTSFFTIAYILIINPTILADAGMPYTYAFLATALATALGCIGMGLWANAPIVLTPGMGINAFFTYTIVLGFGLSWQQALAAVILSGLIFVVCAITPLAKHLMTAVPESLKHGITAGIGLFLTFIGLQSGGLVTADEETFVTLGDFTQPQTLLTLFGLLVILGLFARGVKGSFLIGIGLTSLVALGFGLQGSAAEQTTEVAGYFSILTAADFSGIVDVAFWTAVFSLSMIIIFESMGLLHGLLPDEKKFKKSYQANAFSALSCGFLGTSSTIPTVESASGIAEGGRTGLTAVIVGVLFLVSIAGAPLLQYIPDGAIAPVLIVIGGVMMKQIAFISFDDLAEWLPAYMIISFIPFTYSIVDGIAFGFIAYPLLKLATGQARSVSPIMYVISALFLLNYVLLYGL